MNLSKSFLKPKSEIINKRKNASRGSVISEANVLAALNLFLPTIKCLRKDEHVTEIIELEDQTFGILIKKDLD